MYAENSRGVGRKRRPGAEASSRKEALVRLKANRKGGRRNGGGCEIRLEKPIFDTVGDEEYQALVSRRREEARGFVVEDGDLGYVDEGEEEDWSKPSGGAESTDGESDDGGGRLQRRRKTEKKKVNLSLKAAATITGEGRLSSMFTCSSFKKTDKVKCESILDEVLAEVSPDDIDRERHHKRRKQQPATLNKKNLGMEMLDSPSIVSMEKEQATSGMEMQDSPSIVSMEKEFQVIPPHDSRQSDANEVFTLNALIDMEDKDPAFTATAGWKEAMGKGGTYENVVPLASAVNECQTEFDLDAHGSLLFYILDAYEEPFGASMGTIHLFGKVKMRDTYKSCCAVVKNIQRCVYAIPNDSIFPSHELMTLEQEVKESRLSPESFRGKLHEMASKLKKEISQQLLKLNVSNYSMALVKRNYAFDRPDVPAGEQYVLKINYPFKDPPLPEDLKGESFCAVLGSHTSALELFILKRKIMGPSWLKISIFSATSPSQRVSWCKFEVTVESPKVITVSIPQEKTVHPPAVVTAINLKTIVNVKQNISEIVSASLLCFHNAKIDVPMLGPERKRSGVLSHFTVVRNPEGTGYPIGWKKEVAVRNSKNGCSVLSFENSERALLNRLFLELNKLDSDVLVGHNISGFDLDVLLQRAQACKVLSSMWSKIGRLKRSFMPKLKGSTNFGSGATPGLMSCMAGRLLCDTDLCSRDLLKQEVSFSLTDLSKTQLNRERKETSPNDIPKMFQSSKTLVELIDCGETDAWLSMELMFHLSILPLTLQLTNISGNLWGKTLQGARAQRNEYYLLHTFHSKKFILPDKIPQHRKERKASKRRINHGPEDHSVDELDFDLALENDPSKGNKTKKGPAYAGGLVLEPKKGLYDKYVLLLDFSSLYPSIIQEYNICFTTIPRAEVGVPRLPSSQTPGILPKLMEHLVGIRKCVRLKMKKETGLKCRELDIRQEALKLAANSLYGYLGFSNSRFYAKPLAELITLQGREILLRTVDLVQNHLNLEVIYGDTDSIMIHSGLDDIEEVKAIGAKAIQEVNKKYRFLKIECDAIYKRMLLLRKKKYAAIKLQFKDGKICEDIERKGVDMVRRDWSLLSKEIGDLCLAKILYGGSCEDVVEAIHNELMKINEEMRNGQVAVEKYVITKALTKSPEAYPDSKSQPHVQVALRMRQRGYKKGFSAKDTVPYIICYEQGNTSSASSAGIAERARHPAEVKSDDSRWLVDIDYYLAQQIHPVVSRLCAEIKGTSPERLAECLGLDPSKYRSRSNVTTGSDPSTSLLFATSDEERYKSCEPLTIACPSCSAAFNCPSITSSVCASISNKSKTAESDSIFWLKLHCLKCEAEGSTRRISPAMIANQVKRQIDGFVSTYYKGIMMCDDESCKYTTRSPNFRLLGDRERGTVCPNYPNCNGTLLRKYTEADLYWQLSYFCHILDTQCSLEKMDDGVRIQVEKAMMKIRPAVESAASVARSIRDRCAYGWLQLTDIAI
ncbi:DNA polymerase alpha catalytic subunit isoform X2 [Arabidopsis lyrata subsp. lyrata]|uniref:DNA polymerase alpha catalytic subunit isoform X2 n=1 Tax=Arabidopsis lyrata subsp. lyrata TaxID=81972 RepID=UPI000A29C09A|nr:DNA polymerase alpha catalytic subunit isoform X2 [Arabidopsis lyrata subsp. lyrata]|eukprot:XP_020888004.1 DNA polymerase alpha catalytic subunit isoform X2 [Arabidopsis lyrata subsp. lyrata]